MSARQFFFFITILVSTNIFAQQTNSPNYCGDATYGLDLNALGSGWVMGTLATGVYTGTAGVPAGPVLYETFDYVNANSPITSISVVADPGISIDTSQCPIGDPSFSCAFYISWNIATPGTYHAQVYFLFDSFMETEECYLIAGQVEITVGKTQVPTQLRKITSATSCMIESHSSINLDSLALQEGIPLVGVPFGLNYSSDRLGSTSTFAPQSLGLGGWTPNLVHHYDSTTGTVYYGDGGLRNIQASPVSTGGFYVTDQAGTEVYYFNAKGVHTQTKDALTGVVKYNFSYNSIGQLSAITDLFNNSTTFKYSGQQILITSPFGQQTLMTRDKNGFLASVKNPNGETYALANSSSGLLLNFQKPAGQKSTVTYDSNGYVIKDIGAGGDFISLLRNFNSNTGVQTVSTSTALNRNSVYTTSAIEAGAYHTAMGPDGGTFRSSNQDEGAITSTNEYGNNYQATQAPDPRFGWLAPIIQSSTYSVPSVNIDISTSISETANLSNSTNPFSFTTLTAKTTLQNDSTRTFTSTYQPATKLLTNLSPLNRVTYETLNSNGQLASLQVGTLTPAKLSYDSHGRLTTVTQGSRISTLTYDSFSNVASSKNPLGQKTSFQYDKANRVTRETLPDGNVIAMTYDANGNMTSITPPGKTANKFFYNIFELLQMYLPPSLGSSISGATTYSYNLDKQMTQIHRPDGKEVIFNYGAATGLLTSIDTPSGNYSYSYSQNSDLVSSVTSPDNEVLTYTYAGNVLTEVKSSGPVSSSLQISFNVDGTISETSMAGASGPIGSMAMSYDKDGLLIHIKDLAMTRNNVGTVSANQLLTISDVVSFNAFGEMSADNYKSGKNALFSETFTRDSLGRITEVQESGQNHNSNHSYEYGIEGRLIKVSSGGSVLREYQYDSNGNRIVEISNGKITSAQYDAQDRLIKYGTTEYQYSNSGDLIAKLSPQKTSYVYDVFGNLKTVDLPNGKKIEYIIDGQNRRVGKKVNGMMVQEFIYQSQTQIVAELDGKGNPVRGYIYGTRSNVPDYFVEVSTSKKYRIISDQVGTPQMIVEAKTGAIVESLVSDEFGNLKSSTSSVALPFGFAGGLQDADTGLVRFGNRDYDPTVGRFTSRDPLLFKGGSTNLYSYSLQDPINNLDPSGLNVTVTYYPDAANGLGHIGITVNNGSTMGFYGGSFIPELTLGAQGAFSNSQSIVITTNADQDAEISAYIAQYGGEYNAAFNNCSIQASAALRAGGVFSPPSPLSLTPLLLFNFLSHLPSAAPLTPIGPLAHVF